MPRLSAIAISFLLGATLSLPATAAWKWRDKNGQTQYSDTPPPPSVADQDILQRPRGSQRPAAPTPAPSASVASGSASGSALPPSKGIEPELEAKRLKAEQEKAAKAKADEEKLAAARAENCMRAKSQLRSLEDGIRLARTNEKGEREILDDTARASETQRARSIIASDCK